MMNYYALLLLTISVSFQAAYAALPSVSQTAPKVEVYTIPGCIGCGLVKSMFERRNIPFKEIIVSGKGAKPLYDEMIKKAGGKPGDQMGVPQIFVNGNHIGGYMDMSGEQLDALETAFASKQNGIQADKAPQSGTGAAEAG